jgi:hypothetical protein
MPADDSNKPKPAAKRMHSVEEGLAALAAAAPPRTSGRIRTLAEARSALKIPTSSRPAVLSAWGTPPDSWREAYPVKDDSFPDRVAEFAVLRVVTRVGGRLVPRPVGRRLNMREKSNALWIVHGSIVLTAHNGLVIETLGLGPAFDEQFSHKDDEIARGITTELLRMVKLPRILNDTVERLQQNGYLLDRAAKLGSPPMSDTQRELLAKVATASRLRTPVTREQLIAISQRYITLCQYGVRHPVATIAEELGITHQQARDRIHKARAQNYLAPGVRGRATAAPGPELTKLGWQPPLLPPETR